MSFKLYLSERKFKININTSYSSPSNLICTVPQGSFYDHSCLHHINELPQAVVSHWLLHTDDTRIVFQHKNVTEVEKQLLRDFSNLCDWFVDNKSSVHFDQFKTKSV